MPKEIAFALKDAAGEARRVLVVPGTSHGGAYRDATPAYEHAGVYGAAEEVAHGAARPTSLASQPASEERRRTQ